MDHTSRILLARAEEVLQHLGPPYEQLQENLSKRIDQFKAQTKKSAVSDVLALIDCLITTEVHLLRGRQLPREEQDINFTKYGANRTMLLLCNLCKGKLDSVPFDYTDPERARIEVKKLRVQRWKDLIRAGAHLTPFETKKALDHKSCSCAHLNRLLEEL